MSDSLGVGTWQGILCVPFEAPVMFPLPPLPKATSLTCLPRTPRAWSSMSTWTGQGNTGEARPASVAPTQATWAPSCPFTPYPALEPEPQSRLLVWVQRRRLTANPWYHTDVYVSPVCPVACRGEEAEGGGPGASRGERRCLSPFSGLKEQGLPGLGWAGQSRLV